MTATSSARLGGKIAIGDDLEVSRIGYGSMKLTGPNVWGEYPDRDSAIAVLRAAVDSGVNFIDTADVYGPHTVELLIRDALAPYPDDLVIATKGGFVRGGPEFSTLEAVGNPNYLRQSAYLSARRLGLEQIDLYYLHSGAATGTPFESQIETLAALRDEGLIRHIGLSNVTLDQFDIAARVTEIVALTAHYNPSIRIGAPLLAAAEASGAIFSPWHPITITEGPHPDAVADVIEPIAECHQATVQQVSLAWQLQHSPVTLAIPGTTSVTHLDENIASGSLVLADDELLAITALARDA